MKEPQLVVGITGENRSGKDMFGEFLELYFRTQGLTVKRLEFSEALQDVLVRFGIARRRENYRHVSIALRSMRWGDEIINSAMLERISRLPEPPDVLILTGIRHTATVPFIRNQWKRTLLAYITADFNIRWERAKKRKDGKDRRVTRESFRKEDEQPTECDVPIIGKQANFRFANDSNNPAPLRKAAHRFYREQCLPLLK